MARRHVSRLERFAARNPKTVEWLQLLSDTGVDYALFSGSMAYAVNNRHLNDLDILVPNGSIERIVALDTRAKVTTDKYFQIDTCDGRKLNYWADELVIRPDEHGVEVQVVCPTSAITAVDKEGREWHYSLSLTLLAAENRLAVELSTGTVNLAHPFDTIVAKALFNRGDEVGKCDLHDARVITDYDWGVGWDEYVSARAREIGPMSPEMISFMRTAGALALVGVIHDGRQLLTV